jgi:hypothetical protein
VAYLTIWSYCWAMISQRMGRVSAGPTPSGASQSPSGR